MRIPLLLAARPPFVKWGATIPLVKGEWEVETIGVHDTVASLWSDRPPTRSALDRPVVAVSGGRMVRVVIDKPGTEESISVFARKVA
jgi:hypothetical protein